jgi:fucose permease
MLGLLLFAANAFLFIVANSFGVLLALLTLSGVAIGIFKTGALALIGDISRSTREHTATMNMVEGFFGIGSIIGPAIVARLLQDGLAWKWLYVLAGGLCTVLVLIASRVDYPVSTAPAVAPIGTAQILRRSLALAFSLACFLYVALECSIYVWLPTYLLGEAATLSEQAIWAVPAFFLLRALGRFFGAWMLTQWRWTTLLMLFGGVILVCFVAAVIGGAPVAALSLPLSGLFMSVVYPTLNSKGISCFQKSEHGAVAGVILFFSCLGAGLGPLAMGAASDLFGGPKYCFVLATLFAVLLFAGLVYNWIVDPTRQRLDALDASDYHAA